MATVDPLAKPEVKDSAEDSIRKQLKDVYALADKSMDLGSIAGGQLEDAINYGGQSLAKGKAALDKLKAIISQLDPTSDLAKSLAPILAKATESNAIGQTALATLNQALTQAKGSLSLGIQELDELQTVIDSLPPQDKSPDAPAASSSTMTASAKSLLFSDMAAAIGRNAGIPEDMRAKIFSSFTTIITDLSKDDAAAKPAL